MTSPTSGFRFARLAAATLLLGLAAFSHAGSTIKVVNNSKQPWYLRITDEGNGPLLAQGSKDAKPVELGKGSDVITYRIQPGECCTLQFKEVKEKRASQEVGVVDQNGEEKGKFTIEAKPPEGSAQLVGAGKEDCTARLIVSDQFAGTLNREGDDVLAINQDCWDSEHETDRFLSKMQQ